LKPKYDDPLSNFETFNCNLRRYIKGGVVSAGDELLMNYGPVGRCRLTPGFRS